MEEGGGVNFVKERKKRGGGRLCEREEEGGGGFMVPAFSLVYYSKHVCITKIPGRKRRLNF